MSVSAVSNKAQVQSAIALASRRTGVDFSYLLGQAQIESGLNSTARAGTSSASGLYQFVEQSWLKVVKQHGAEHGLGWAADSIHQGRGGHMSVGDPATRRAILALRNDPQAASLMAAEHASDNKDALEGSLGREATGTDLYMAHFLGLGGARSFLRNMAANPDRTGASLFPAAARANRAVFYGAGGQPRTLSEIYQRFGDKLDAGAGVASGAASGVDAIRQQLTQAFDIDGGTVVTGNGEDSDTASSWATAMLRQVNGTSANAVNPLKPTPNTARLAYMMLASMGA